MKTSHFLGAALLLLGCALARAELVASDVTNAENTLQTTNQRLFASSQGAFYEITLHSTGWSKHPVGAQFRDGGMRSCYFLGITESAGMIYTACTEDALNPLAKKHLFGMSIFQSVPQLTEVGELQGIALPNGLAADASGNLYLADSGWPLLPGTIQKITLASAYTMASQSMFHHFIACKPNGLRFAGGKLYVTVNPFSYVGVSQLLRYDLEPGRLSNQASLFSSFAFLDDFALVDGGAVLAEFLGGRIVHINEQGKELHRASFSQPTSVTLLSAPAFGPGSLLVTERNRADVQRFTNDWGLQPRQ